ncbi:MAG: hypothetical protein LLG04_02745 [Parachlamydia sp.]|nr:hypothetical protein [Parachlamydia sp.]
MQAASGRRNWRLAEPGDSSPLVEPAPQLEHSEVFVPTWAKVAIGVSSFVTGAGWYVVGQVFASQFNANPAIAMGANLAAGVLGRVTLKIICTPYLDQKVYHFTTRYDHVIFQNLSIFQQALKNTVHERQAWFPVIFFHAGYVISGYIIFKATETKGNQPEYQGFIEERPLLEGDTWGSPDGMLASLKPFLVKSVAFAVSGAAMSVIGHSVQSFTVWRLGWVAGGIGLGLIPAQQLIMQLHRHRESFMRTLTSHLSPKARNMLALAVSLMPAIGTVGVCVCMGISINARSAVRMDAVAAVVNLSAGFALSFLDVAAQDRYQHPTSVADRQASEKTICMRCWEDLKRRSGDYVGIGLTLVSGGVLLVSNVLDPSPGSTMDATIIVTTTVGTAALAYLVESTCPPSKNPYLNQINFRATRSLHIVNAVYLIFLTNYFLGRLSAGEFTAMWAVYGVLMGLFIKPNFDQDPNSWEGPSTTYLAETGVTADGYVEHTI